MEKLDWMPLYIDRLLSSPAWQDMKDFQRGWYIQLLLRCTRSEPLGYLRMDSNLWTIAGARRNDFWESHKSAVLACFKVCEMEGHRWIYNERLFSVMEKQSGKYARKKPTFSSPKNLDVDVGLKEKKVCSNAIRIPDDFIPKDQHYALAADLGMNCDMEFQKFRDYFLGVAGTKGLKRDWDATFRNWLRNSMNYGGQKNNAGQPSKARHLAHANFAAATIADQNGSDCSGAEMREGVDTEGLPGLGDDTRKTTGRGS